MTDFPRYPDYDAAKLDMVPEHLRGGLQRYFEDGVRTGHGLRLILEHASVHEVVAALDDDALAGLRPIVQFIYGYAPGHSHGSKEAVAAWIRGGGMRGNPRQAQADAQEDAERGLDQIVMPDGRP